MAEDNALQDLVGITLCKKKGVNRRGERKREREDFYLNQFWVDAPFAGVHVLFEVHLHEFKDQIEPGVLMQHLIKTVGERKRGVGWGGVGWRRKMEL